MRIGGMFGMPAGNILEFTVVLLTTGQVVATTLAHPDLFWVLQGGGGGKFGVVIRTFPSAHLIA